MSMELHLSPGCTTTTANKEVRSIRRSSFAALFGTMLENYDLLIFAHLLHVISGTFFPSGNESFARWLFALGYLFRPLGGIIFAHFGDKIGRTPGMLISMLIMAFPTLTISLLPGYERLGLTASFIICICRCMQGFSSGAEFTQAGVVIVENAPESKKGFYSSLNLTFFFSGALMGAIVAWVFTQPFMPTWGWRIAFFMGSFIVVIGLYMRRKAAETPEFEVARMGSRLVKFPLLETLKKDWVSHLCYFGLCAGSNLLYTNIIVHGPLTSRLKFGLDTPSVLLMTISLLLCTMVFLPIAGLISDKVGYRKVMAVGTLLSCVMVIFSFRACESGDFYSFLTFQALGAAFYALQTGPGHVLGKYMYPTERRCSGTAFAVGVGASVFGGLSPVILHHLKQLTGGVSGPIYWTIAVQSLALLAIYFAPNVSKKHR